MPAHRDLSPGFRRELRKVIDQRDAAEARYRAVILRGLDQGERMAAIARALGVDRRLLWKWVQAWKSGRSEDRPTEPTQPTQPTDSGYFFRRTIGRKVHLAEIARFLGVTEQRAGTIVSRPHFPHAVGVDGRSRLWDLGEVEAWAKERRPNKQR